MARVRRQSARFVHRFALHWRLLRCHSGLKGWSQGNICTISFKLVDDPSNIQPSIISNYLLYSHLQVASHRLILASSSPYLATLVSSHPNTSLPLTLPISKLQMTFLLDFIYNGEVEVEKEKLYQFLNIGEKMQLKGLVKPQVQEPKDAKEVERIDGLAKFKERIEALIEKNGDVWRCVVCSKSADESKGRERLKNHVQIHMDLTHACDVCGKTCNTKSALGQHMYKQHRDVVEDMANKKNDSKRFKCEDCGMKSTTNAALEQHMSKRHKESIAERKVKVEKHHPTESFSSELDQDSGTQLDKEANDQEMEELQEGESILEIDLDTAEVDDSAEDNLTDDEDVNDQDDEGGIEQSRRVGEVDKEKIEAMIEKVFFL